MLACRTLGLAEDTLGLTEDTLGQLPILEKALGCKAVMDGDSEEDIKAEQDKCHRLRDRNLSAKNLQKINMLYDSARMRNINVKSVTDNIFTAKDTEEYIELTGKQWKEFLNQKRPNPRYTGFSNSSDDNKRLAEPWSVIWVLRAEPMRRKGGPTETESVVSMAEGDVIIKKYMFIVLCGSRPRMVRAWTA
ncbi:hypothetical protein HII31_06092 [Pseudocercospora fuligena]|uniref:Uncharacterized protein n=1 Tax=Pseudocercospora fuligena TaxID=685502 RepID=A0A8H6VHH4_9PEZI|nr:hypothetical protein HII31_06092 [Pseudocercospora fuligena]